jgi:hypothetical protein
MAYLVKEATEILQHLNNFKSDYVSPCTKHGTLQQTYLSSPEKYQTEK